jgi:hypothetical protein
MKKVRYLAGLAGLVPAAAAVAMPATAHAAAAEPGTAVPAKTVSLGHVRAPAAAIATHQWSCFDPEGKSRIPHGWCNGSIINGPSPFFDHNGASDGSVHNNSRVKITCWYRDANGLEDHVVRINPPGSAPPYAVSGHIHDANVSFSFTPASSLLKHC